MNRQLFNKPTTPVTVNQPVALGGTGASNINTALFDLELIGENAIGVVNGAVPLDANSKVPNQYIPGLTVAKGDTAQVTVPIVCSRHLVDCAIITNYDCQRSYVISTDRDGEGGASATLLTQELMEQMESQNPGSTTGLVVGTITLQAPQTVGLIHIYVNNTIVPIDVILGYIEKPTFVVHGELYSIANNFILRSKDFHGYGSVPDWDLHGFSQNTISMVFQIATDVNFNTMVFDNIVTNNERRADISNFPNGDFYARFKYIGDTLESPWSDTAYFIVYKPRYPNYEQSTIHGLNVDFNHAFNFGRFLDISDDGLTLITGSPDMDLGNANEKGVVHIFQRTSSNDSFTLQQTLTPPVTTYGYYGFGTGVVLADQGNLAFVLCDTSYTAPMQHNQSQLFIYKTSVRNDASTFTLVTSNIFSGYELVTNGDYGQLVTDPTGRTILLSTARSYLSVANGETLHRFYVKVFKFENNTLTFMTDIVANINEDWTDLQIDLDNSGNRFVIGTPWQTLANDPLSKSGAAYVYDYDTVNANWVRTATLAIPGTAIDSGAAVAISGNGKTIAIADFDNSFIRSIYGYTIAGVVYTYEFDSTSLIWNLNETLIPASNGSLVANRPHAIKLSDDGKLLFMGNDWSNSSIVNSGVSSGVINVYDKPTYGSNHWEFAITLEGSVLNMNDWSYLGERIAITPSGSVVVGAAQYQNYSYGIVHIFQ